MVADRNATDEGVDVVTTPIARWATETTPRNRARAQMLWMVDQARRAAKNGRADAARWWRHRAVCALWNMS